MVFSSWWRERSYGGAQPRGPNVRLILLPLQVSPYTSFQDRLAIFLRPTSQYNTHGAQS